MDLTVPRNAQLTAQQARPGQISIFPDQRTVCNEIQDRVIDPFPREPWILAGAIIFIAYKVLLFGFGW